MPGAGRGKRPSRRKHSFGGCKTCRRRHVKCDQIRPACLTCRAINATCEGYEEGLRWLPPAISSSSAGGDQCDNETSESTTRHHLFSLSSRAAMSSNLRHSLGSSSVDASLAQIDARAQDLEADGSNISIGPFAVLSAAASVQESESSVEAGRLADPPISLLDTTTSDNTALDVDQRTIYPGLIDSLGPVPALVDWFDPILGLNNSLQWSDLFSLDFDTGNSLLTSQLTGHGTEPELCMFPPDTDVAVSCQFSQIQNSASLSDPRGETPTPASNYIRDSVAAAGMEQNLIHLSEVESPAEAQFLLKHFHDYVIPQCSFMASNTKSPWNIFQLSDAARTLSELTFLQTGSLKHANVANLYATLACSAYHLAAKSPSQISEEPGYWKGLFTRLRSQGSFHMQASLRKEIKGPRKARYKDQLMAVLGMLACATISGHHADARHYIIEGERLVRMKGLAKRQISRRCRILHHVYTWIRVVGESTYALLDYTHYGSIIDNMSAAYRAGRLHAGPEIDERPPVRSVHNTRLDDFLRLEPHQSDSDLDIDEIKGRESGLHDIHLNDSRRDHGTMYNEIYGISETWLSLVSQTTRLGNILEASKYGRNVDGCFREFLDKRASRLEHIVCSFALEGPGDKDNESGTPVGKSRSAAYHMLQAMNSALVILFYRRVRIVNPLILQGHVSSVVQSLGEFDEALSTEGLAGPGSAWPAFIAGCEALSRRDRTLLMAWLDKGFDKCGLETFNVAMGVMKEVWKRQNERTQAFNPASTSSNPSRISKSSTSQHSWIDVCREQDLWVPLY